MKLVCNISVKTNVNTDNGYSWQSCMVHEELSDIKVHVRPGVELPDCKRQQVVAELEPFNKAGVLVTGIVGYEVKGGK